MSKIKIRVWNPHQQTMFYSKLEQSDNMLGFRFYLEQKHYKNDILYIDIDPNQSEPVYMLATGMIDKKGYDIWIGDIVKYFNRRGEVIFDYKLGCYAIKRTDPPIIESDYISNNIELTKLASKDCRVVGNIYENPNLCLK